MMENFGNTSKIKVATFNKGMVKDVSDIYMSEGFWNNALNAINATHKGDEYTIGNEPSNYLCATATYDIIGIVHIEKTRWVIFSTNDTDSEIGIFDESKCGDNDAYTVLVNDACLNFRKRYLITGVCKQNYDCTWNVYWQDNNNPDRVLNLNKVPWFMKPVNPNSTCWEYQYTTIPPTLDCEALRLHPLIQHPCVSLSRAIGSGQITNGSYIACIAYSENGIRLTDYSMPSVPQGIWSHTGIGGALEVNIDNIDENYDEYELVIIGIVNQQTVAKKIGNYSTKQTKVNIDLINQSLVTVDISLIPLKSIVYEKSEKMFTINGYLLRTSPTTQPYVNYQPLANKIGVEWVAIKYPMDYYWKAGKNVGRMRDEVYPFFIRWIYNTGARTASYHIPGRVAKISDLAKITDDNTGGIEKATWEVYDTSTIVPYTASPLYDGGIPVWKGEMQYWHSTELYPNDKYEIWEDLCGTPIRHHKMPSEETIHIHDSSNNIYVLGVMFNNIQRPVDLDGQIIQDIVGYEILSGSREGNRSIVAKGIFNNMWWYPLNNTPYIGPGYRRGLYQNYPYNDLTNDKLQVWDYATFDDGNTGVESQELLGENGKGGYYNNMFSFHSPDTNFYNPYLGDGMFMKISKELEAYVTGNFELPYKHPKFKFITDFQFGVAAFLGIGIGFLSAMGKVTLETTTSIGITIPAGATQAVSLGIIPTSPITTSAVLAENLAQNPSLQNTTATVGGLASFLAQFTYYTSQGINQVLEIINQITRFRDYALQYNSHGYYKVPRVCNIKIRDIKPSGMQYIGSGIQDYKDNHIINNLNRNKYVLVDADETYGITAPSGELTRLPLSYYNNTDMYEKPYDYKNLNSLSRVYYGAIKYQNKAQYGQLQSIIQIPTDSCVYSCFAKSTDIIFGGDIYINRYTEKNPYMFFNTWMFDMPDGTEFKYSNYINGPIPKYWADYLNFDADDFDIKKPSSFDITDFSTYLNIFTLPSDWRRFDEKLTNSLKSLFTKRNAWFYLFYNGVRDFFVESELNLAYRDYGEEDYQKFYDPYGNSFQDLSKMFRSDLITTQIYNKYDLSLSTSKLFTNFSSWGSLLPRDYDPLTYTTCFEYLRNRVIYSLQYQDGYKRDSWRSFLPLNYKDFNDKVSSIKSYNATGSLILFEHSEPLNFVGIDTLQTDGGVKVSIGDGGLFAQNIQSIVNADDTFEYGACISSRSVVNTPHGYFWVSQQSGKVMTFANSVNEISKMGMKHWFSQNLPSKLLETYPDYPLYDNPVLGIGVQAVYDNILELLYISKKDYIPLIDGLLYNENGEFYYNETVQYMYCQPGYTLDVINNVCVQNEPTLEPCLEGCEKADYEWGLLYNKHVFGGSEKITSSDTWRIPSVTDITTLGTYLGGMTLAGSRLKEAGILHWDLPNTTAINDVGFTALGSGVRAEIGIFFGQKMFNMFWTTTEEVGTGKFFAATLSFDDYSAFGVSVLETELALVAIGVNFGLSIRLVRDAVGAELALPDGTILSNYVQNDGDEIATVKIGTLVWTVRCIAETKYRSGLDIVYIETDELWEVDQKGALCYYNNLPPACLCEPEIREVTVSKPCHFGNPRCWKDASWTISYDPKQNEGQGAWISFHDWKPELMMPSAKHFYTIKGNALWKHNEEWDSYTHYYGKDYGWMIDFPIFTPNDIEILRSIEYYLDVYKYYNDGMDFKHILDDNFDVATIYNSEQISGELRLFVMGKNKPLDNIKYPKVFSTYIEAQYTKEENKYRLNQFWDITKDRGEFSGNVIPMFNTESNGYKKIINPLYTDYLKSTFQRKKFRHYGNNIILQKLLSGDKKYILKMMNVKLLNSPR